MKALRKLLATVLTLAMVACTLTVTALASDPDSEDWVAMVGDEGFLSLADAIAAAPDGGTVVIINDCVVTAKIQCKDKALTITTDGERDYTIDCSGYTADFCFRFETSSKNSATTISVTGSEGSHIIFNGGNESRAKAMVLAQYNTNFFTYVDFVNGNCTGNGSAIQISGTTDCTFNHCIFSNNRSASGKPGAAILVQQNASGAGEAWANDCVFTDNVSGGAGVVRGTGSFYLDGCTFTGNASSTTVLSMENDYERTVSNCIFSNPESEVYDSEEMPGLVLTTNTYGMTEAPTLVVSSMPETGTVIPMTTIFSGYDDERMTATVTKNGETATEVNGAGEYVVTIAAKSGYVFPAESVTTFNLTITAVTKNVAEVNSVQYTTFGAAIAAAEEDGTITLLDNLDDIDITKRVVINTGSYTIASATITSAALPLDISSANITAVTFDGIADNTVVFTGDATTQAIANTGKALYKNAVGNTIVSVADYVATVGDDYYATLPEAIADEDTSLTTAVLLHKDIELATTLTISKAVKITVADGVTSDIVITTKTQASSDYMIHVKAQVDIEGTATARIKIDGKGKTYNKPVLCIDKGSGNSTFKYVDICNSSTSYAGGGIYITGSQGIVFDCCNVYDCKSTSGSGGGAIYMASTNNASCTFKNGVIAGNYTASYGGAICNGRSGDNYSTITLENVVIKDNTAAKDGAAIRSTAAFIITNCIFTGNTGLTADIVEGSNKTLTRTITGCTFDKTESEAISRYTGSTQVVVTSCTFAPGVVVDDDDVNLSMYCTIGDTITANVIADITTTTSKAYDSIVLKAKLGDGAWKTLTPSISETEYTFAVTDIYSQCMTDVISVELYGIKAGQADALLAEAAGVSVADYCKAIYEAIGDNNVDLMTFMASTLAFGAECQKSQSYNTDNLANAESWVDTYKLTEACADDTSTSVKTVTSSSYIKSMSLRVANKVGIVITVHIEDGGTSVTVDGKTYQTTDMVDCGDNNYKIYLDKINPTQYDEKITVVLDVNKGIATHTVTYSVNDYCARMYAKSIAADLMQALYNYGIAAERMG